MPRPVAARARQPAPRRPSPVRPKGIPWASLPLWQHPEHGSWKPETAIPTDPSSALYDEKLRELLCRKWQALFPGEPVPDAALCAMKPADGTDQWCTVDMLLVIMPPDRFDAFSEALKKDNLVDMDFHGVYSYMSPFFEWGLADYWENGYYDR